MKHYRAHDTVDEGFYWNPRRLAFKSLEERGRLPGEAGDAYVRVPALLVLPDCFTALGGASTSTRARSAPTRTTSSTSSCPSSTSVTA